jgi:hypothetical protein
VDHPENRYAWNGDVALAYQSVGTGCRVDRRLRITLGHAVGNPALSSLVRGLAARTRLIITDRRGFGLSDRFAPNDIHPAPFVDCPLPAAHHDSNTRHRSGAYQHHCSGAGSNARSLLTAQSKRVRQLAVSTR